MKTSIILSLFISFAAQAKNATVTEIAVGVDQACAIADSQVQCWGKPSKITSDVPTGLVNPRGVTLTGLFACVIADAGIKCWGKNDEGELNVPPNLRNPTQLFAQATGVCALSDDGLKCWGDLDDATAAYLPSNLNRPRQISLNFWGHSCALTDDGPKCWGGRNFYGENNIPSDLGSVDQLSVTANSACAITKGTVRCWGGDILNMYSRIPVMTNPRGLSSSTNTSYVIADEGVYLIDYDFWMTSFKNPRQIAYGLPGLFAITDDGIKCWSDPNWPPATACAEIPANLSW
jgi:hypothetical protein